MIQVSNLCKSYGSQELFIDANFSVNARERVGLVGRNGHGKTTLLRLLLGRESADSGTVNIPRNYRLGYLEQHLNFTQPSLLQEACLGLPPDQEHDSWRAEKILAGLGFTPADMERSPAEFSGGFQVRLNLAKVLVSDPDMLLLDEPTNYLDVVSIRWLTRFLNSWKGELVLITHDRGFMDSVTTHTLGIHRGRLRKIEGSTGKLYEQIAGEEEVHEKTRLNDEKRRKEVELFVRRFRAKARLAGMVQSRIKSLEKQGRKQKLEKIENLEFSFNSAAFPAKVMMDVSSLAFQYGNGPRLFSDLNLTIHKDDRICIVGKNGKGKTTLLKVLAQNLAPISGNIRTHPSLRTGYFEQTNIATLDPNKTVEQELLTAAEECSQQQARNIAGAMMFSGDQALKPISVLSGGEKSRVMLGKLLVAPCHLLLLDEPTNHLDMESCDSMIAALDAFDGAVMLVTHNEMFLHTLANRLIIFDRGKQFLFEGSYQDFLNDIGWENDDPVSKTREEVKALPAASSGDKKAHRKRKAKIINEKSRTLKPLQYRISQLEKNIEMLESELSAVNQRLVASSTNGDGAAIADLAKQERDIQSSLETDYNELDAATSDFETKSDEFQTRLANL